MRNDRTIDRWDHEEASDASETDALGFGSKDLCCTERQLQTAWAAADAAAEIAHEYGQRHDDDEAVT